MAGQLLLEGEFQMFGRKDGSLFIPRDLVIEVTDENENPLEVGEALLFEITNKNMDKPVSSIRLRAKQMIFLKKISIPAAVFSAPSWLMDGSLPDE